MLVNAYTVDRVTGNMHVVDSNKYKQQWSHLRRFNFPPSPKKPIVDMLIGLDCADLLYAIEEKRGRPGEPVARLTPLGWTCVDNADSDHQQTRIAHTILPVILCQRLVRYREVKRLFEAVLGN